jgi:hypothetical protein
MPLTLSLREGDDFYVADKQVFVAYRSGRFTFTLAAGDQMFKIGEEEATEIMPDVFISSGDRPQHGIARVVIDAPKSMRILKGDRWREENGYDKVQGVPRVG